MSTFNAAQARAKRPCPLWVDAFQRDTQHLEADEIGAYLLLLMAMWTRESCDFPDDDTRLARVCRVSVRLWKSRVGPTIRAFLTTGDGVLFSKRLREEATYTERQVQNQSDRKAGKKPDNPLDDNDPPPSADTTTDRPRHHPTQQPNNPTVREDLPPPPATTAARAPDDVDVGADEPTERERVLVAMGHDPTGLTATGRLVGSQSDMIEFGRWRTDLGLTVEQILAVVAEVAAAKRDGPAGSFRYFTEAMRRRAGEISRAPLAPAAPTPGAKPSAAERYRRIGARYGDAA